MSPIASPVVQKRRKSASRAAPRKTASGKGVWKRKNRNVRNDLSGMSWNASRAAPRKIASGKDVLKRKSRNVRNDLSGMSWNASRAAPRKTASDKDVLKRKNRNVRNDLSERNWNAKLPWLSQNLVGFPIEFVKPYVRSRVLGLKGGCIALRNRGNNDAPVAMGYRIRTAH